MQEEEPHGGDPVYDLTIVTVCRNVRSGIMQTVGSVLRKKRMGGIRIEHLFVDGASTDGTPGLLEELRRAGKIEAYVSEPDKGIYDAMNKGIRMANGKVLFFLNVGDLFEDGVDLKEFVDPITGGGCDATFGLWRTSASSATLHRATFHIPYFGSPCNHQAFFLSKEGYENLGGYNWADFRCMADADLMWRLYAKGGRLREVESTVALFADGGFSSDCQIFFLNEMMRIACQHLDAIKEEARRKPDFARYLMRYITQQVLSFPQFMQKGRQVQETIGWFRELCNTICSARRFRFCNLMFRLICGPGLRASARGGGCRRFLLWRLPALLLPSPKDAKYNLYVYPYSLKTTLQRLFKRRHPAS